MFPHQVQPHHHIMRYILPLVSWRTIHDIVGNRQAPIEDIRHISTLYKEERQPQEPVVAEQHTR